MQTIEAVPSLSTIVRILLASPEPKAIARGPELQVVCNEAFATVFGVDPPARSGTLRDMCAPLWAQLEQLVEAAVRRGESGVLDDQLICRFRNGISEEAYFRCACGPFVDDDGDSTGVIITLTETTEQLLAARRTAALRDIATAAASARSVLDACRQSLAAVARHSSDIPFALIYLCDAAAGTAHQVATAGLPDGGSYSPNAGDLSSTAIAPSWPITAALKANEIVVISDVIERFGVLPSGGWPFAPRCAVIAPVTSPGGMVPDGALVAGISARHEFDPAYRAFLELVVKQIAAAIAGGRAHEERERQTVTRAANRVARARRQERIRAMKSRFAGALEERTRLAREIHDTLLQGVTGVALQLRAVLPHFQAAPASAVSTLSSIVELAEKTGRDARQAVWDLRPVVLGENALPEALDITARRLTDGTRIAVRVVVSGQARQLPVEHQTAVVRVVQEAVSNAVRHAAPREVRLRVDFGSRRLRVVVSDDGRGFTVRDDFRSYAGHWGLLGMRERATRLGGAIEVQSLPAQGTTVTLLLPYASTAPELAPGLGTEGSTPTPASSHTTPSPS
ncbi:MAG: signal transduction histidine kinase [Gemmatimonadetes bacterium]|nr:signal transduction histidine kinase [Gemmatimonadota bacterium]